MRRGRAIHRTDLTSKALIAEAQRLGAKYMPQDGTVDGKAVTTVRDVLDDIGLEIGRHIAFSVHRRDSLGEEEQLRVTVVTAPEKRRG